MIRKLALSTLIIAAMILGAFATGLGSDAHAQDDECSYADSIAGRCTLAYTLVAPTATPTPRPTPQPTSSAVVSADTVQATGGSSGGPSIAFTGSESRVLGYVGAGLIGFGAVALVAARRKVDSEEI